MNEHLEKVFKKGSKTYFNSSLFFPKKVREEVFQLYGFVRVADDYVDSIPQDSAGFYDFKKKYLESLKSHKPSRNVFIDGFVELSRRKGFDPAWALAFLESMEMDITKKKYLSLEETLHYIYGSAEVIGLFMCSIMDLPEQAYPYAQALGRSMQYINFIRDIAEDVALGRTYLPLGATPFSDLAEDTVGQDPEAFRLFIREQADLYLKWQKEAEQGYSYIPTRSLIPIKTAADMYQWTARVIHKDPFIIYKKKVKPSRLRILWALLKNTIILSGRKYA